ncbi:hypothetical protein BD410DRAFT_578586 [Rickenella mellea]|uniref:Peptidase S53 activation domain-containing protein n=1 Tax=Rickenella mellea TaxID=50990 RepID=A0A4Y7QGT5_9AGAM|nr:hypothetical protein BD410DRAFT_578586 [Rickenella mellea]
MVFLRVFLAFALLVSGLSNALSIPSQTNGFDESHVVEEGWARSGHPLPDMRVDFRMVLRRTDSRLVLMDIDSTTGPDGADGVIGLSPQNSRPLERWLAEHGIEKDAISFSPARNWISFNAPIRLAERLFQTKYHMWTHLESGDTVVRPLRYSLPEAFHEQVESIQPPARFT